MTLSRSTEEAAGPGTGSASPWTHVLLDTELSWSWPRRAVLAPCVQEVLVASAEVFSSAPGALAMLVAPADGANGLSSVYLPLVYHMPCSQA